MAIRIPKYYSAFKKNRVRCTLWFGKIGTVCCFSETSQVGKERCMFPACKDNTHMQPFMFAYLIKEHIFRLEKNV
jgi:hypothetical protein